MYHGRRMELAGVLLRASRSDIQQHRLLKIPSSPRYRRKRYLDSFPEPHTTSGFEHRMPLVLVLGQHSLARKPLLVLEYLTEDNGKSPFHTSVKVVYGRRQCLG